MCREEDPELFFPVGNSGPAALQIAEAKAVCRRCPVASECLAWALDTGQEFGVWGGMDEDERKPLSRARRGGKQRGGVQQDEVEEVLDLLDSGHTYAETGRKVGRSRQMCVDIWRKHRSGQPPALRRQQQKARAKKEVAAR